MNLVSENSGFQGTDSHGCVQPSGAIPNLAIYKAYYKISQLKNEIGYFKSGGGVLMYIYLGFLAFVSIMSDFRAEVAYVLHLARVKALSKWSVILNIGDVVDLNLCGKHYLNMCTVLRHCTVYKCTVYMCI